MRSFCTYYDLVSYYARKYWRSGSFREWHEHLSIVFALKTPDRINDIDEWERVTPTRFQSLDEWFRPLNLSLDQYWWLDQASKYVPAVPPTDHNLTFRFLVF